MNSKTKTIKAGLILSFGLFVFGLVRSQSSSDLVGAPVWADADGDGKVTINDAVRALLFATGIKNPDNLARNGLPAGPATLAQIQYGRYQVSSSYCADCHEKSGKFAPNSADWLAGDSQSPWHFSFNSNKYTIYAANLTPDKETGLGDWTTQDIFNALRYGKDPDGHYLTPPMPWPIFRNRSDDDLWAIVAYLTSLKAVSHPIPEPQGPAKYPDGSADWSSYYAKLPPLFIPYPSVNE